MGARDFGRILADERKARRMDTQAALAEALGPVLGGSVSDRTISAIERGDRKPSRRLFRGMASLFGWDVVKRDELDAVLAAPDRKAAEPDPTPSTAAA